jgi:Uma2 family endonuclease
MYDLPSENPEDPGLPDIFHDQQPQLLKETFQPPTYTSDNVFVASDLNLYYDRQHEHWYKRPDWFAVVGISPFYQGRDLRNSYVVWDEPALPLLVVELLSPGTKNEDLGRTTSLPAGPPTKWEVYEKILQIPYYVVFSRYTNEVQFFKLTSTGYVKQPSSTKTLWFPELQLGLGLWDGKYDGLERQWLRWHDVNHQWLPTLAERAEAERQRAAVERQRAEAERQRAAEAVQQAEREQQRAAHERQRAAQAEQQVSLERQRATAAEQQVSLERQRATVAEQQVSLERQRAMQLAAKLRALGIDPESL